MNRSVEQTIAWLGESLPGRVSLPGQSRYAGATAIWAKPVGRLPRVVVHCHTAADVRVGIQAARESKLPLSVRAGGHDWAGRALCQGIVLDLSGMNGVAVSEDRRLARILGGARAADVAAVTDSYGVVPVTGTVGAVGMGGFTLGGGYGPLIGRFGLALDNLVLAEVVLADGRFVSASEEAEADLFWALRGGGGNFGVVTAMHHRLHDLASIHSGMVLYPFGEADDVLERCAAMTGRLPDALTLQVGVVGTPDGPLVMLIPTWAGPSEEGAVRIAPFLKLGTVVASTVKQKTLGEALTVFDGNLVSGRRTFMETCWIPDFDSRSVELFLEAARTAPSSGCAIFTHEFRGAASRVPLETTAFGLRRDHVLVEILANFDDREPAQVQRHRQWAKDTLRSFDELALPGGYANLLVAEDPERVARSYGPNAERLIRTKRQYDPDNVFVSTIPLPSSADESTGRQLGPSLGTGSER